MGSEVTYFSLLLIKTNYQSKLNFLVVGNRKRRNCGVAFLDNVVLYIFAKSGR